VFMNLDINFLFLNLNAIVTYFLGFTIFYFIRIGRVGKHLFYYTWSLGFVLYATQMVVRANNLFPIIPTSILLMIPALILFLSGLWSLSKGKGFMYIVFLTPISFITLIILYSVNILPLELAMIFGQTLIFLPIFIGVLHQRIMFGRNVDKFALGWLMLFISNLLLFDKGWLGDFFGITSKLIILAGTLDYDFVILSERVQKNISSKLPPIYTGGYPEGGLKLVIQNVLSNNNKNIKWIFKKVEENTVNDLYTYFFAFQNVTFHEYLRKLKWINPGRVFVFLFSSSTLKESDEFTILQMGISQIGATLSEIIKNYAETKQESSSDQKCIVIFDNLSLLIHSFGVYPVYNLLLDKMGILRANRVELFAILQPDTHKDESVTALFKSIADEVIYL
jgi:hypothetical protein